MAKRKMRALRGCREARQRSYWWGKVRITTYITMVILQLLIVFYDSFWGLPQVGLAGLLWQLIAVSTPAMLFVYVVLIIVVGVKMNRISTYEERYKSSDFEEEEERKWRQNAAILGLMLVVLMAIAVFIAGSMGVFNYVKDLKCEPKVTKMTLNEVLYKHHVVRSKRLYAWLFPHVGGGEFTLCFASCNEKDKWGLTKYYYFDFSQYETDVVDQMLSGVLVKGKAFSAMQFMKETDAKGLRGRGFKTGVINGGVPALYLVRYYPHSHIFINATPVRGKRQGVGCK